MCKVDTLEEYFGRYCRRLHELAFGIDESPVHPDGTTKSISVEDTFECDVPLADIEAMIRRPAEKLWSASRIESRAARTVVLKLKTSVAIRRDDHPLLRGIERHCLKTARAG